MTDSLFRGLMAALLDDFRLAVQRRRERARLNASGALGVLLLLTSFAEASPCPLTLVSGEADRNAIVLTLRNAGKLPIRGVEFNCAPLHPRAKNPQAADCRERNLLFFPGTTNTVSYAYAGRIPQTLLVSVVSITLSDGFVWKPSKHDTCRVLQITPRKIRK